MLTTFTHKCLDSNANRYGFFLANQQGVPIRIEVGPRDVKAEQVVIVRRDNGAKVKALQFPLITLTSLQIIKIYLMAHLTAFQLMVTH